MSDLPHCLQSASPVNLRQPAELPPPGADEVAHMLRMQAHLRQEINKLDGRMPFYHFMQHALYAPGLGYYMAGQTRFGHGGDFVTAPELGDVFARCLANTVGAVLDLVSGEVLEFGAGRGSLAADLLLALERQGALPHRYRILELSPDLRAQQRQTLARKAPHLLERVAWLDSLPESIQGVVLANEVLDAMPVHLFELDEEGALWEMAVCWRADGFGWERMPLPDALQARVTGLAEQVSARPYRSEINLAAEAWMRDVGRRLDRGVALLIDYGFPAAEYYHEQRVMGTLMCHYRHYAHADPLIRIGLQDITAHVDFSAMAAAGQAVGLDVIAYMSQGQFLMEAGLPALLRETPALDSAAQLAFANQLKRLTLPSEMGEVFKVLALGKGLERGVPGLSGRGRAGQL